MSGVPRRGGTAAHSRSASRANLSDCSIDSTAVLSSSALPRVVSYSMMDRPLDTLVGTPSKNSKYIPPSSPRGREDVPVQDSFRAISRAIHNVKIRLSALEAKQRLARSTARHHFLYARIARMTRIIFIVMVIVFTTSLILNVRDRRPSPEIDFIRSAFHRFRKPPKRKIASDKQVALEQILKHRPKPSTTRHFETGPWVIGVVTDQDKESCRFQESPDGPVRPVHCGKANAWISYFKRGILTITTSSSAKTSGKQKQSSIEWLDEKELYRHGKLEVEHQANQYGGRGMELSELEWFNGHLLTPDDRTGILLEIVSPRGQLDERSQKEFYGEPSKIAPSTFRRAVLHDGPGNDTNAFFKAEWMVVKDDQLIVGGHGKSFTDPTDGTRIKSNNPKWIKVITDDFNVSHVDWSARYDAVAKAAGVSFPGYLMHEAVLWSVVRKEWIFLPRRRSTTPYKAEENDHRGSNIIITASEDFKTISTQEVKGLHDPTGLRGFSTAKFVPGTGDLFVAAIRTIEVESNSSSQNRRETASFLSVFDLRTGDMILSEQKFSDKKFEGLVFL